MRTIMIVLALGVLLMGPAIAEEVELHLTGQIQETPSPDLECSGMRFTSAGSLSGEVTGEVEWIGGSCVDLFENPGTASVREGHFSLGGGLLEGTYEADGGPDATLHVVVEGTFAVTGGTGDFEGATGGGIFTAAVDLTTSIADVQMIGSIDLPS